VLSRVFRRLSIAVGLVALVIGAMPTVGLAASPLAGETLSFIASSDNGTINCYSSTSFSYSFMGAVSAAWGPYPGRFQEFGSITIANGMVTAWTGQFTITNSSNATVATGDLTLAPGGGGPASCTAQPRANASATLNYVLQRSMGSGTATASMSYASANYTTAGSFYTETLDGAINTQVGNVSVTPPDFRGGATPVTVAFSGVTRAGSTNLYTAGTGPAPPSPLSLRPNTYFNVHSTAVFSTATVCITDPSISSTSKLWHYEGSRTAFGSSGALGLTPIDVTATGYPDAVNHRICSVPLASFGPFAITGSVIQSAPTLTMSISPAANAAGWNNTDVTVTLSAIGPNGVANTGYSAAGAQPIATTTVSGATTSVVLTAEGVTTVNGFANDSAGNRVVSSLVVRIDKTPPIVSYSGNAGTYTVDQIVNITCAAVDPMNGNGTPGSGLASTCRNVNALAYTFPVGANTISSSVADNAGNIGRGSATFSIGVTYPSLCNLTLQFVETSPTFLALPGFIQTFLDQGVADLCKLLGGAQFAPDAFTKGLLIASYQAALPALVFISLLTSDQAAILLALSNSL
jgi:hypothetical protein